MEAVGPFALLARLPRTRGFVELEYAIEAILSDDPIKWRHGTTDESLRRA
jgi:hypothetical protein